MGRVIEEIEKVLNVENVKELWFGFLVRKRFIEDKDFSYGNYKDKLINNFFLKVYFVSSIVGSIKKGWEFGGVDRYIDIGRRLRI